MKDFLRPLTIGFRPASCLAYSFALACSPAQAETQDPTDLPSGAVATHQGFIGYWVVTGSVDAQSAMDEALARCNMATGGGCNPAGAFTAREAVIGHGVDGAIMMGYGDTPEAAREEFDKACIEAFAQTCDVENSLTVARKLALQSQEPEPRKFAAMAVDQTTMTGSPDADPRVWIAFGQASWNDAVTRAMEPCEAALGTDQCRWLTTSGQTVTAFYRATMGGSGGFQVNLSAQKAIADIDRICTAAGQVCELLALNPASEEAVGVYDLQALTGVVINPPVDQAED